MPILRRQVKRAGARRGEAGVSHQALDHSRMTVLTREEQQVRIRRVRATRLLGEEALSCRNIARSDGGLELGGPDVVLRARRGVQLPRRYRGRDRGRIWVHYPGTAARRARVTLFRSIFHRSTTAKRARARPKQLASSAVGPLSPPSVALSPPG